MGGKKIILIDDDRDYVDALKIILEANAFAVSSAASGVEGISKARKFKPDLIIIDVMMSSRDEGFQTSYKIRHDTKLSKIPILMLSGVTGETGLRFSKYDEGFFVADAMLHKPVKSAVLIKRINELIEKAGN